MATLRDVAHLSGVSTATVSNVLNSRYDRVSPETRERVLAAVRKLRYRPTTLEKDQKAILAQNLGVMVTDITKHPILFHGYFREALDGIMEEAMFQGWSTTVFALKMWDDLGFAIRRAYDGRCDGLIVIAPSKDNETVAGLQERGVPLVLLGCTSPLPGISSVDIDNEASGALIARHFLQLGHRRFGYCADRPNVVSALERERGFFAELTAAGVEVENFHSIYVNNGETSFDELALRYKAMGDRRPTAVMGWYDGTAIPLVGALKRAGLRVPEDISVVGVDDSPGARECDPPLSSIPQHLHSIGKRAARMLIDRLGEETLPDEIVRFGVSLTVRESTAPAPGAPQQLITSHSRIPR